MSLLEICPLDEVLVEALQNEEKRFRFYEILQKSNLHVVADDWRLLGRILKI